MKKNILILFLMTSVYCSCFGQNGDNRRFKSDPYKLSSKVIVFTNWYFVRPGFLDWTDESGKNVFGENAATINRHKAKAVPHDSPSGIKLFVEQARPELPTIKKDKPWDKGDIVLRTIILENGVYHAWGSCRSIDNESFDCYLESKDGINWTKPELGIVEFEGNRKNNLIEKVLRNISVFIDPAAPTSERYKSIAYEIVSEAEHGSKIRGMMGAVSPDGFRWKKLSEPLAIGEFDTQNIAYYDTILKKYVFYVRTHMVGSLAHGQRAPKDLPKVKRKAVGRIESQSFGNLPGEDIIIEPSPDMLPSDQFSTNCYTTIPEAPDLHLMFPTIYNSDGHESRIEIYSSYNGKNWHRIPGPPVYSNQKMVELDKGGYAHPNLVERSNGDWILPSKPGFLVWSKGRLAGIEAKEKGEFATVAFVAPGKTLKINALTHRAGYIKLEVVGMDGKPIKGHSFEDSVPVNGDQYKSIVKWQTSNELGVEKGEPVYLRFEMKMAKIYELYFE